MVIRAFSLSIVTLAVALSAFMPLASAQVFDGVCSDSKAQQSTVCKEVKAQQAGNKNPLFGPKGIITFIINLISAIVGIAAVIMIIVGALKMVTSGTNPQDVSTAREMVIYALVGVVIAVSAQLFVRLFLEKIGA